MNNEEEQALQLLLNAAKEPSEPTVLMYIGIDKQRIRRENGQPISWDKQIELFLENIHHGNLRILGDFDVMSGIPIDLASIPRIINDSLH